MLMTVHSLFSLSTTAMPGLRCSSFFYLSGLQGPKAFYISHSPTLALVDARTIYLHIQLQVSCTGPSVLFSSFVVSLPVLVSSWDRTRTDMGDTFNILFEEPA